MDYAKTSLADALAAQYVAGTLRGPARRRFEALLPSHPALQHAVREWQDRLMPLTGALQPQAPSPAVWRAIEQRLWPAAAVQPWWQRLGLWRALSGAAVAAVVGLAVLVATPPPAQAPVVVVLQSTGSQPGLAGSVVASFSGDGRAVVARPLMPVALQADRVLELWCACRRCTEVARPDQGRRHHGAVARPVAGRPAPERHRPPGGQHRAAGRVAHRPADRAGGLLRQAATLSHPCAAVRVVSEPRSATGPPPRGPRSAG